MERQPYAERICGGGVTVATTVTNAVDGPRTVDFQARSISKRGASACGGELNRQIVPSCKGSQPYQMRLGLHLTRPNYHTIIVAHLCRLLVFRDENGRYCSLATRLARTGMKLENLTLFSNERRYITMWRRRHRSRMSYKVRSCRRRVISL